MGNGSFSILKNLLPQVLQRPFPMTIYFPTLHCSTAFSVQRIFHAFLILLFSIFLGACGGNSVPPVSNSPPPIAATLPATPTISSIAPATGTTGGGTTVTISGTNFTGATGVTFGGAAGTGLTVVSATELRIVTPAGTAGAKDVSVTTADGTATLTAAYTYTTSAKISTVAGTTAGWSGDGAAATAAQLRNPYGVAFDNAGNMYIADTQDHRIRVVCKTSGTYFGVAMTAGNIYTIAGTGGSGFSGDGGPASAAQFNQPAGLAFDAAGNLYFADWGNNRIRVINKTAGTYFGVAMTANNVYTVAGTLGGFSGDGGAATAAQISQPYDIAFDATGNLYIAAAGNSRIRVVNHTSGSYFGVAMTANNIYTVAGTSPGLSGDGGAATAAQLSSPGGMAFDAAGNLYISDTGNHRIRVVNNTAGTYFGVAMTPNNIYTVAGTSSGLSGDGSAATAAKLSSPYGLAFDTAGNLYIAAFSNHRIRVVNKTPGNYFDVAMTANNIYTLAGTTAGLSGDDGVPTAAQLNAPFKVTFDTAGILYIGDYINSRIRAVSP